MAPVDEATPAAPERTQGRPSTPTTADRRARLARRPGPFVVTGLAALAAALYLPYALKAGWYYDDWALYASFKHAGSSWGAQLDACTAAIPGGRKLTCLYHVTEFHLFGGHRFAYHLTAIAFLVGIAGTAYAILRRCRLPWQWAATVAALLILFPACDSTRLWPTGAIGQYVILLELVGVLLVLEALRSSSRGWSLVLHAAGTLLFLVAMLSYEIAVPLVALNGIVYAAALRNRAALWRGASDLALAVGFVVYRLAVEPADPASGFTVHRTLDGDLSRGRALVSAAWQTWHHTFLPGAVGTIGILGTLALAGLLALREPRTRPRLLPWFGLLAACLSIAAAATFVFLTANDLYLPQIDSTFNRVVLPGSIAYVGAFVSLLGLGFEVVRRLVPVRRAASAAVALVVLASAAHQLQISSDHKRAWEASWSEQERALDGYVPATAGLPAGSRLVGLGTPIWEAGFVPIFAASWDLGNAIAYVSGFEPAATSPLLPNMSCGRRGLTYDGVLSMPYRVPGQPLYFIRPRPPAARAVRTQAECRRAIASWARPPLLAPTLRGL